MPKNKVNPKVKITLDKPRTLKFDLNAMVSFEGAGGAFDNSAMPLRDLRILLWACLLHEDETLTEQQVGSFITPDNMGEISSVLKEAFEVALPESEGKAPLAKNPLHG